MVTIANAAESATTAAGGIASFIPLLIIGVILAIIAAKIAKRKGKHPI